MTAQVTWRADLAATMPAGDIGPDPVWAIGDIHGCYDLALGLLGAITADLRTATDGARPTIVFCGDYVDRGPRSADVLAMLVWLQRHAPCEVVCLRGNHEAMLLAFLDTPREASAWLQFGGDETLRSYGIELRTDQPIEDQAEALRDSLLDRLPASHLDFLRNLPVRFSRGDYLFVHAGLRPGVRLDRQTEEDCLWIRDEFLNADHAFGRIVVHGHSWWSPDPIVGQTRIGIDTGAYQTGVLTALRLAGATAAIVQARAPETAIVPPPDAHDGRGAIGPHRR